MFRASSSSGRAPRLHRGGERFESAEVHHQKGASLSGVFLMVNPWRTRTGTPTHLGSSEARVKCGGERGNILKAGAGLRKQECGSGKDDWPDESAEVHHQKGASLSGVFLMVNL